MKKKVKYSIYIILILLIALFVAEALKMNSFLKHPTKGKVERINLSD